MSGQRERLEILPENTDAYIDPHLKIHFDSYMIAGQLLSYQWNKFSQEQEAICDRLTQCEDRIGRLEKAKKESVMNPAANRMRLVASYQEKLYSALEDLRGSEDLSVQIQAVARAIQDIDQLFAFYSEGEDKYRKQLVLKLRGALKLHYTKALFTDRQVSQLTHTAAYLERPSVGADEVWEVVTALEDIGLSTFPELPELGG